MEELIDIAAGIFGTTRELIFSKKKDRKIAEARHAIIYYLVIGEKASISHAARMFGLDHSTGHHAMKVVRGLLETNREFRDKYERFIKTAREFNAMENSAYEVVLCNTMTNELLGFESMEMASIHMGYNKDNNYNVYEKVRP